MDGYNNPKRRKNADLSAPHGLSKAEEKRVRAQIQQDLVAAFMRALDEYAPSTIDKNKIGWGSRLLDAYKSSPNAVGFYAIKERYFGGHSASAKARKWLNSVNDSRWDTIIRAAAKEAIARHKALSNPKRRKNVNAEIFSTYARGRRAKFGASDDPMRFASGPFSPQFKRVRRNSKASRSNLVFFMETGRGKRNIKVYKVGKKYEMVVHEKGQPDLTAQTTSKAELKAVVGQFHRVGYMTGEAKYKVKHDALGLGIE